MDNSYRQRNQVSWLNVPSVQEPGLCNWNSVGGSYPAFGPASNEASLYQQASYVSSQDSPTSSYSSHSFMSSSPNDGNNNCATPYTHQNPSYIFDVSTATSGQSPPFASFHLDESFFSQNSFMPMSPSFSPMKSSPFHLMCPASNPKRLCPCTNMSHEALLELPYKRHLCAKPLRAMQDPCRKALLERFPSEYRDVVIEILTDPLSRTLLLMDLVVRHEKDAQGNRFGCICCPNARFQAAAKAERHLRGLFDIRTVPCQYCTKLSIHRDDNKDHEKICPRKNKLSAANTLSHTK